MPSQTEPTQTRSRLPALRSPYLACGNLAVYRSCCRKGSTTATKNTSLKIIFHRPIAILRWDIHASFALFRRCASRCCWTRINARTDCRRSAATWISRRSDRCRATVRHSDLAAAATAISPRMGVPYAARTTPGTRACASPQSSSRRHLLVVPNRRDFT